MSTVIIDVNIAAEDAAKQADSLALSIKGIKDEQVALKKANKETSTAYVQNAQSLRTLQAEQKAYIQLSQSEIGSNNQLRAQLAILTQQYNAMGKEERDNTVAGKALQIQVNSLSKELKTNESAVGDNRRNVGNYRDVLNDASGAVKGQADQLNALGGIIGRAPIGFQLLGTQVQKTKDQLNMFRQANDEAKAGQEAFQRAQTIATKASEEAAAATAKATEIGFAFSRGEASKASLIAAETEVQNANIVATEASAVATEAQAAATASATNATNVFKVALASTGIGAVVILIAGLIAYLSKFDPIVDKIEQGLAGFGAALNVVGTTVVQFFNSVTSLGDALTKIGNAILHPIDSFKSLGASMKQAAVEAANLKAAQQDLEDQMKIQEVTNARAQQQVQQLILQSRNRSLSEIERQNLLKQAAKVDQDNFNQRSALANAELKQATDAIAIKAKLSATDRKRLEEDGIAYAFQLQSRANIGDADIDKLKQAELNRVQILQESTNRQEKIQNQSDALAEKAQKAAEARAAKLEKIAEARKKQAEEDNKADLARIDSLNNVNNALLTSREAEFAAITQDFATKIEQYKKYNQTVEQLEIERDAKLKAFQKKFHDEDLQIVLKNAQEVQDLQISQLDTQGQREFVQLQVNNQRKLDALDLNIAATNERIAKGETDLTEILNSQLTLRNETLAANEAAEKEKRDAIAAEEAQRAADLVTQENDAELARLEFKKTIQDQTNNLITGGVDLLETVFGKQSAIYKTAYIAQKAFALATVVIQTQQALAANRLAEQTQNAGLSLIPIIGIGLAAANSAKQAVQRAFILAGGILAGATITAQAVAGFSEGGQFISDGRGARLPGYAKRDNTNAKLRSGEVVIVSEAGRDPNALAALSAINEAYGGRALAPAHAMADGGIAASEFVSTSSNQIQQANDYANLVLAAASAMPAPIVDVRDITSAQQRNDNAVVNATL